MRLVDRDGQCEALAALLAGAADGRGGAVLLRGAPGHGKTALLGWLVELAEGAGFRCLAAEPDALPGVAELAGDRTGSPGGREPVESSGRVEPPGSGTCSTPGTGARAGAVGRCGSRAPVLVAVDDAGTADVGVLLDLVTLARRAAVVLALTDLPRLPDADPLGTVARAPGAVVLDLPPLRADTTARLLDGTPWPVTGGNPALVRALARDLAAGDAGPGPAYRAALAGLLDRCGPEVAATAHATAVLAVPRPPTTAPPAPVTVDLVADLLGRAPATVADARARLAGAGLDQADPAAVLDVLPAARRAELHLRAARTLHERGESPTTVADHLVTAGLPAPAWAVDVLVAAADLALAADDVPTAVERLTAAHRRDVDRRDADRRDANRPQAEPQGGGLDSDSPARQCGCADRGTAPTDRPATPIPADRHAPPATAPVSAPAAVSGTAPTSASRVASAPAAVSGGASVSGPVPASGAGSASVPGAAPASVAGAVSGFGSAPMSVPASAPVSASASEPTSGSTFALVSAPLPTSVSAPVSGSVSEARTGSAPVPTPVSAPASGAGAGTGAGFVPAPVPTPVSAPAFAFGAGAGVAPVPPTSHEPPPDLALTARLTRARWQLNPAAALCHLDPLADALAADPAALDPRDAAVLVRQLVWHGRTTAAGRVLAALRAREHAAELPDLETWLSLACPPLAASRRSTALRPNAPHPSAPHTSALHPSTPHVPATPPPRRVDPWLREAANLVGGFVLGDQRRSAADAGHYLRHAQLSHTSPWSEEPALLALLALVRADRAVEAERACALLLDEARGRGAPTWVASFAAAASVIALRLGDLAGAAGHARAALDAVPAHGWGARVGLPLGSLILADTLRGRSREAGRHVTAPVPDALFDGGAAPHYLHARAHHHLASGRDHAALADFLACGDLLRSWGLDLPGLAPWRTGAAEAWTRLGNHDRARRLVFDQLAATGADAGRPRALALRALAPLSPATRRPHLLTEAADALERCGDRYELAATLARLGAAHHALGDHRRARAVLRRAWHLARACGARPLCARLEPDAADPVEHDTSGLTGSERKVAALAVTGLTNRQIAEKLFVTPSTVEQHLTRVFRKLRVTHRTDLPTTLHADLTTPA